MKAKRIGVFVCHCGLNIAENVDVDVVVSQIARYPGVAHAENYIYMCSDPGQDVIRRAVRDKKLDSILICSCSPSLHQTTFRKVAEAEGINPFCCEIANIREQCAWPHNGDKETATRKALTIIRAGIEKLGRNTPLFPAVVPLTKRSMVIGAGIAGIRASLDIADAGYEVVLVEKCASIGGHVLQFNRTFPSDGLIGGQMDSLINRTARHTNIRTYLNSEIEETSGYVGQFKIKIKNNESGKITEETVGAIIIATGYDLLPKNAIQEYASDADVLDGLQFEQLLTAGGDEKIKRPSDGKIVNEIVFIQCAGSRDPEHGVPYCSRICCMYTAKQARLYKRLVPDGQAYVFYMDVRSDAKGYEEYVRDVVEKERVLYLRGRVSRLFRDGNKLKVWGVDTLSGKSIEIAADLVVLATAMVPSPGIRDLARKLNIITDQQGFLTEAHLKLRPVETLTAGIYLAGTAQWPRTIPDTVASASGAASKIISLFSREELLHDPVVAVVDSDICSGCGQCVSVCPFHAINLVPAQKVARVNEVTCNGCGACSVTCPSKAIKHRNWTSEQLFEMIDSVTAEYV
jgi:heterodisulfide reductase subunit A-like polyferredoxin